MESEYINIEYMGENVEILRYLTESQNQFNARIDFIRKVEKDKVDWTEANRLSVLWHCIIYKKCKYSSEIYNKIMSYEKIKN